MDTKDALMEFSNDELLNIAKVYNIVNRQEMSKEVLVDNIIQAKDKVAKILNVKDYYIKKADIGFIVAFRTRNGKVKSAKIAKKNVDKRTLVLETEYKAKYKASFDDVLWIKTGPRWPKGVYKLLKGVQEENEEEK